MPIQEQYKMDSSKYRPVQSGPSTTADPEAVYEIEFPHEIPTYVLARFAGVNVDPYTNFVATILLRDFQLPIKGQRHISDALSNIPVFLANDERLQFGWGQESMMRSRYIHSRGYEHSCIIIALSSTFHESYAAEVLYFMTMLTAGPKDMIPHIKQWRELIRAGNGSFTPSDFDILVEDLIRLDPYCLGPGSNLENRKCLVPAKSMAKVLIALSRITSKKEKQLTLTGGPVIAWFAAIGEYFYDLRVTIKSPGGDLLHGQEISDQTQLVLYYKHDPDLLMLEGGALPAGIEKTARDDTVHDSFPFFLPFGGRVEWHALLSKVFGRAYLHLEHELAKPFDKAIGAAASFLQETVAPSAADHGKEPHANRASKDEPTSYGIGLITNLAAWLPELQRGQGRMERQLKRSYEENVQAFFEAYEVLKHACKCHICCRKDTERQPRNSYCLPTVVDTIVALGLAITRMTVVSRLYPTREGIQKLYLSQVSLRIEADHQELQGSKLLKYIYFESSDDSQAKQLREAVQLFSGTTVRKETPNTLAGLAHEGICPYFTQLQKSDQTRTTSGRKGEIRVISGAIYGKSKFFNRVSTEPVVSQEEDESWGWEEIQFDHRSMPLYFR